MKKFILKDTGKEIKIGDMLEVSGIVPTPFGNCAHTTTILINEDTLNTLIEYDKVKVVEDSKVENFDNLNLEFFIQKIANRLGWHFDKTVNYINNVGKIMPAAAFSIILKEIAIELDKKYEDHIENSPEIFVISTGDGRITKANKAHIKNYRNFAAFRTIEDAKIACRIIKPLLKDLFATKSGK